MRYRRLETMRARERVVGRVTADSLPVNQSKSKTPQDDSDTLPPAELERRIAREHASRTKLRQNR